MLAISLPQHNEDWPIYITLLTSAYQSLKSARKLLSGREADRTIWNHATNALFIICEKLRYLPQVSFPDSGRFAKVLIEGYIGFPTVDYSGRSVLDLNESVSGSCLRVVQKLFAKRHGLQSSVPQVTPEPLPFSLPRRPLSANALGRQDERDASTYHQFRSGYSNGNLSDYYSAPLVALRLPPPQMNINSDRIRRLDKEGDAGMERRSFGDSNVLISSISGKDYISARSSSRRKATSSVNFNSQGGQILDYTSGGSGGGRSV